MINKKVVFCIPVRNESSNLKSLFKTLDKLNLKFEEYFLLPIGSEDCIFSSIYLPFAIPQFSNIIEKNKCDYSNKTESSFQKFKKE